MSNDSKRVSQLSVTTTLSQGDRVVVLSNPNGLADAKTITAHNFANSLVNSIIPTANNTQLGVVKVGAGLAVTENGVLSAPLPIGTTSVTGVVKVGSNINVDQNGIISNPIANNTQLGIVRVGSNINVDQNGLISVSNATRTVTGAVKIGTNLNINQGVLSNPIADRSQLGIVKVGSGIDVDQNGLISVTSNIPPTNIQSVGFILTTNSAGGPAWSRFTGVYEVVSVNESYTVSYKESVLLVNPSINNSDITITFPVASAIEGKEILVKLVDAGAGYKVTITTDDPGNAYLEDPITGAFVTSYDLIDTGQAETWIHDGSVYRHLSTARATPIFYTNTDNYSQVVVKNESTGLNASADLALYNDIGNYVNGTGPFIDIGIDGSNYSNSLYSLFGPNDGYVYVDNFGQSGGNLLLGTAEDTSIIFHAGGTLTENKVLTVNSTMTSFSNQLVLANGGVLKDQISTSEIVNITPNLTYQDSVTQNPTNQINGPSYYDCKAIIRLNSPTGDWVALDDTTVYLGGNDGERVVLYTDSALGNPINISSGTFLNGTLDIQQGVEFNVKVGTNNYTFGSNGVLTLPPHGKIIFSDMPNQYIEGSMGFRIHSSDGIQSSASRENSNTYVQVNQNTDSWEAFPEDDTTGPYPAWAWIRAELPDITRPVVFIENKRGDIDETFTWAFQSNGALNFPGMKTVIANGHISLAPGGSIGSEGGFYVENAITVTANNVVVHNNVYDELLRPLLNPNALDINADGGTSTSVFAIRDEAFTGGGSTTVFGRYEAALDGGVSFNNRHSASYIDGGGANVL